jgi:hypothetical protein
MSEDYLILLASMSEDDEWLRWESEASKLELPVDYYVAEFILPDPM